MAYSIELMTGIVLLVLGLSFVVRTKDWIAWLEDVRQDQRYRALPIGAFALLLSTFMFAFHRVWSGVFMIVTVIGALGIVEAMFYLIFPGSLCRILTVIAPFYALMLRFFGVIFLIIAFLILGTL